MKTLLALAKLIKKLETIEGRKKLQKIVHILQECSSADFGVSFSLSHYGAFSSELASTLDVLVKEKVLDEKDTFTGSYTTKTYQHTKQVDEILVLLEKHYPKNNEWMELADKLNKKNTRDLEAMSTIIYFKKAGWDDDCRVKEQFEIKKPHLIDIYEDAKKEAEHLLSKQL